MSYCRASSVWMLETGKSVLVVFSTFDLCLSDQKHNCHRFVGKRSPAAGATELKVSLCSVASKMVHTYTHTQSQSHTRFH